MSGGRFALRDVARERVCFGPVDWVAPSYTVVNMIRCFLVINNFGKPRLMKFYERLSNEERRRVIESVRIGLQAPGRPLQLRGGRLPLWRETQLIYRHFATLYFIVICDKAESELGILDLIQVYVETWTSPSRTCASSTSFSTSRRRA